MAPLGVGALAPDLPALSRSRLRGGPVVLFFYPRDDTETCTKEACAFRDELPRFAALGATVLGVSPDGERSHERFRRKYGLPYALVPDTDHAIAEAFGVWQEKVLFGRRYMGVVRTTFVVDAAGRIARVFDRVRVDGHADEVAGAVAALTD